MAKPVIDRLEVVEVEPQQREALARVVGLELVLELLAEMETVGDLGQRGVTGQTLDLLVRPALSRDILLHVDPSAPRKRLIGDADYAAIAKRLNVFEVAGVLQARRVVAHPLNCGIARSLMSGVALCMKAKDVDEWRAGP